MKIKQCYIENFGKLSEYTVSFNAGLNSTLAENGWGKSTLCAFLRAMFYGLGAERRQSLDENDRKKYFPWQGGRFGGSLTFSVDNNEYRIERSFGKKSSDDTFSLVDTVSGMPSEAYSENIGFELFGIDAAGFERTIFISEKSIKGAINNDTIAAKLSDLVGTDGDVGAISDAIERLEDRRKYYQKRGNSGEIATVRAKISECDAALDNLERRRVEAEEKEALLTKISEEISRLEAERAALEIKLEEERRGAEKRTHREQYAHLTRQLAVEREQLRELSEFFKGGIPTATEIDDARDAAREIERIKSTRASTESERFKELSEIFIHPTDIGDITAVTLNAERAKSTRLEADAVAKNMAFMESTLADELGGEIPSRDVLESGIAALKKSSAPVGGISVGALALLSLIPAFLVSPFFFLLTAALLALSIPLVIVSESKKKSTLKSVSRYGKDVSELEKLLAHVRLHDDSMAKEAERLRQLNETAESLESGIDHFLLNYPKLSVDRFEAIAMLDRLFREYYTLKASKEARLNEAKELDMRLAFLKSKVEAFTEKYKTESSDPFEEIRQKLSAYNYASMLVAKREDECKSFRAIYSINESDPIPEVAPDTSIEIEKSLGEIRERLIESRRNHVILDREYNNLLSDVERIDEVRATREQLSERLTQYTENLDIIQKTIAMLGDASSAMTSRYIGGTKAKLTEYISEIGSIPAEIALSNDFVLKIFDRGETRSEESYSRGMRDVYAFALRLALSESLWNRDIPFLVMDDPFTALDGERLTRAKALVSKIAKDKQVIYFTCSDERAF